MSPIDDIHRTDNILHSANQATCQCRCVLPNRRKNVLLYERLYSFYARFLAEDVGNRLDDVLEFYSLILSKT